MNTIPFIDTSAFFAFLNKGDVNHSDVRRSFSTSKRFMTNYIFDELMTLLTARGQKDLSVAFGEELRNSRETIIHYLSQKEEEKSWQLYKKYRDHALSFTDCTTLIVLQEHHLTTLLSFDDELLRVSRSFLNLQ